ncbi:MAG: SAM-dependent methyltransferase [Odoribacter sp.]|nr:SAM-dependent methyltransferase [Odoribacter sp.]
MFSILNGRIFLIPVTLGGNDFRQVIPDDVIKLTISLRYFVVENLRSARRYLRLLDKSFPIDESVFFELNEHTSFSEISSFLEPVIAGNDIGLMSEAGLPGIADPGASLLNAAHNRDIRIIPQTGPSSIILALISAGMNGQNFTFNGYLPVKPAERDAKLRKIEKRSETGESQIFMETPYRAQKMFESVISVCNASTKLCVAADITLPSEYIKTKKISEWRKEPITMDGRLVVFLIQSD